MKQAGVFTYKHSIPSAELVWQEALKLNDTPVDASALRLQVTVDLPTELLANIDTHGNVDSSMNFGSEIKMSNSVQEKNITHKKGILPTTNVSVGPSTKTHQEPPKTNLPKVEPEKKESPITATKEVEKAKSNVIVGSTNGSAVPNFQAPLTVEASSQVASKFVVLLEDDKEERTFEYKAESQLTRYGFLEIIRQSFPYLGNKGFVFCVGGIALDTDKDLADHVKRRTTLSLVKESLLIEVEIKLHSKPYQWHALRSVTLQRLSESIPLPSSHALFSQGIMLNSNSMNFPLSEIFGIQCYGERKILRLAGHECENEELLDLELKFETQAAKLKIFPETTFKTISEYAIYAFQLNLTQNQWIEFFDTEGFQLLVDTIGESEGGTIIVRVAAEETDG